MCYIGDMHADLESSLCQLLKGERIVKVFGIFRVDGKGGDVTEVPTKTS